MSQEPVRHLRVLAVPAEARAVPLPDLRRPATWFGLVALALAAAGAWFFRVHSEQLAAALSRVGLGLVAGALSLACLSLALRVWRWQLILRRMGHHLPWLLQARAYLAGLALSSTPGKLGEASRALLLGAHGVPASRTLGAFLCDRLADVLAVAGIGSAAALWTGQRQPMLEALLLVCGFGGFGLARLWLSDRGRALRAALSSKLPLQGWPSKLRSLGEPLRAWAKAWSSGRVLTYVLIAAAAYGLQGLVFFLFVNQVHAGVALAQCLQIFCVAILIGAASLLPGGLGAMDLALVWQLQAAGVPTEAALVATVATRASTLWFAWLVGLAAWFSFSWRRQAQP